VALGRPPRVGSSVSAIATARDGTQLFGTTGYVRIDSDDDVCVHGGYHVEFDTGEMLEGSFAALACE
jgi:hypothetical protein